MEVDDIILFLLNTLSPCLFYFLPMIARATGLRKFLVDIRSPAVVYKVEEEDYFAGGGMGVTNMFQHKIDISDSKPTSNPYAKNVRIFSIEEVDFCTAFVGGVPENKICGLMKLDHGYINKYKTHADIDKGCVDSVLYLTPNGTNLFLKYMVSLIIGDVNQACLSQVGGDLSKDTPMAIM